MKQLILFFIMMFFFFETALAHNELERLNFFPQDDYLISQITHAQLHIDTPQKTVNTKEVTNYQNILSLSYAHRFTRKMFLGINSFFAESSENVVAYGIPLKRRFTASGFKEPEIFGLYRLKFQNKDKGLVDFYASFSPSFGHRDVGTKDARPLNGRNIIKTELSHGLLEENWEFRSAFFFYHFGVGEEKNGFTDSTFDLGSYYQIGFMFSAQYQMINPRWLTFGGIGAIYSSSEVIKERTGERREIQAGTGSLFRGGIKYSISDEGLLEMSYTIKRYEYFVKSPQENLDGEAIQHQLDLLYKVSI